VERGYRDLKELTTEFTVVESSRVSVVCFLSPNPGVIGNRLTGLDVHFELNRRLALEAQLDPVDAGFEIQVLERAVEVVDDADVVAVDEHLRIAWRALDADAAVRRARSHADVSRRWKRIAVWTVSVR